MNRILIVDDDLEIRSTLAMILELEGYECRLAASATDALKLHFHEKSDMIVLDHLMPGMSGAEFYEALRKMGDQTPVLLLSAAYDAQYCVEDIEVSGELDRLVMKKPFDVAELLENVARMSSISPAICAY